MTRMLPLFLALALAVPVAAQDKPDAKKADWKKKLTETLKTKKLSLSFSGTPMPDVIGFMRMVTQVNMVLDPSSKLGEDKVDLKVAALELGSALKLMLTLKGCEYQLRCGAVVIGKKGKAAAYPMDSPARPKAEGGDPAHLATWDKFQRKVTLDFNGTPFSDVVTFLGETSGVKVALGEKLTAKKIAIKVDQLPAAQALALIAHSVGGKLVFEAGEWKVVSPEPKEGGPDGGDGEKKKEEGGGK